MSTRPVPRSMPASSSSVMPPRSRSATRGSGPSTRRAMRYTRPSRCFDRSSRRSERDANPARRASPSEIRDTATASTRSTPITPTPVRRRLPARTRGPAQRRKARPIVPAASPSRTCRLKSTRPRLPPLGPHLGETALALVVGLARRLHEAPLVPVGIARVEHPHAVGLVLGFLGVHAGCLHLLVLGVDIVDPAQQELLGTPALLVPVAGITPREPDLLVTDAHLAFAHPAAAAALPPAPP